MPMTEASHPHLERDLRAMTADGVAFSAMVGLGETYVPAFALAAGLGEVVSGLVATVPMLAGACLQMVTPAAVRCLGSYRRWVVLCARLQALSFVPLIVGAAMGKVGLLWVGVATVAYWAFGMSTSPAWNAWVTSLVPSEIRARFFARRARAAQAALLGGLVVGGLALEHGRSHGVELAVFAALFAAAMTSRFVSSGFLAAQSEAPGLAASHRSLGAAPVWERLRSAGSVRVLTYLIGMKAVTHIAAPYFTPYMLGPLDLSYGRFMTLIAASFAARVAVLPLLGRLAQQRGARSVLWLGGVGIVPLPRPLAGLPRLLLPPRGTALRGYRVGRDRARDDPLVLRGDPGERPSQRALRLQPGQRSGHRDRCPRGSPALHLAGRLGGGLRLALRHLQRRTPPHPRAPAANARGDARARGPSAPHPRGAPVGRSGAATDPRQREQRDPRSSSPAIGVECARS